jgi:hypothetical protein
MKFLFRNPDDYAASPRPQKVKGTGAFVVLSAIVPAGGTSAANCYQREIRHALVL